VRHTLKSTKPVEVLLAPAAGLHVAETRRSYLFENFRIDSKPKSMLAIGRGRRCDIRLDDPYVSRGHAVLVRKGPVMWLYDQDSTNGVYINHQRATTSVALVVGMQIQLGHTLLIAVDKSGAFPIPAMTVSEMCREAARLYGSNQRAGDHVGRSREFVRRQHLERDERFKSVSTAITIKKTRSK
jgi:hypothetical protein